MIEVKQRFLLDLIKSEDRFARSTNIEFDYRDPERTPDYKFTAKGLNLLETVLDTCLGTHRERAWTIVGPYGSGKSIFCLLMLQLLTNTRSSWSQRSLAQLERTSPELARRVEEEITDAKSAYLPVIVQGSRSSFDRALSQALLQTATDTYPDTSWAPKRFVRLIQGNIESMDAGVTNSQITVDLFEEAIKLAKTAGYRGLIIVADEFGKFLERAAWQGDVSELVTSQYIAELASGSSEPDLLFFVVLHQGLTSYMTSLTERQGMEWAKIQGRFQPFEFTQNPDDLYDLVSASLTQLSAANGHSRRIGNWSRRAWTQVKTLPAFKEHGQLVRWQDMLPRVFPFHPIALYALPRLSARLSQNERTLFTFLGSDDPVGFKAFLRRTELGPRRLPSLTLDYLFDYFVSGAPYLSLGPEAQKRLSEVDVALERLGDRNNLETRVVKVVGTLSLLGDGDNLPSSEPVIAAALNLSTKSDKAGLSGALGNLLARKVLVFRKYVGSYKIWQGSDFDFDGVIRGTREEIREDFDLTTALQELLNPRPVVARRHSFEKGTTRFFSTAFCDSVQLANSDQFIKETLRDGIDGLIILTVPGSSKELLEAENSAAEIANPKVIVVVPTDPVLVQDLALELASLRRVRVSYPELEDDPVALKELAGRIDATEELLRQSLESLAEPSIGDANWYWQGKKQKVTDRRQLQSLLSSICDEVFPLAPVVLNELINRSRLSSTVVIATKKIIGALIEDEGQPNLGFSGNGPEVSIFKGILEKNRLYQPNGVTGLNLKKPRSGTDEGVKAVWGEIDRHIKTAVDSPHTLDVLYDRLSNAPYGVRKGIIPLFIWIVLIHRRRSVSLYENGTFQTAWSPELFDRFVKAPQTFTCRWLMYRDATGELLNRMNAAFPGVPQIQQVRGGTPLSGFLEHLYHWYQELPDYSKHTKAASEAALGLRRVVTSAVDPIELIFRSIPEELGLAPWSSKTRGPEVEAGEKIAVYAQQFGATVTEIEGLYPGLLSDMIADMARAFRIKPVLNDLKLFFENLDPEILEHVRDPVAQAFLLRARDSTDGDEKWLESVGAALASQAPKFWLDHHVEEFKDKLALVALTVADARRRAYAVSLVQDDKDKTILRRFLVEDRGEVLMDEVVAEDELGSDIESVASTIVDVLNKTGKNLSERPKRIALIRALQMLSTNEEGT